MKMRSLMADGVLIYIRQPACSVRNLLVISGIRKGYIRFLTVVFIAGELRIYFLQEELLVYRMLLSVQPV